MFPARMFIIVQNVLLLTNYKNAQECTLEYGMIYFWHSTKHRLDPKLESKLESKLDSKLTKNYSEYYLVSLFLHLYVFTRQKIPPNVRTSIL